MQVNTEINTQKINFYTPLIRDYLDGTLQKKGIVNWDYSLDEIIRKAESKNFEHRAILADVLTEQNNGIELSELCKNNISAIKNNNTYTVTTGHQLCIYGGPAYFFSKIIDTIKLSQGLNKKDGKNYFVPLFWMASEDHDFEEISSINWFGQNLKWDNNTKGAVGDISTESLQTLNDTFLSYFGENHQDLKNCILNAFQQNNSLSKAIRIMVNELLGKYGILILDGNHSKLKKLFAPFAIQELQESFCFDSVNKKIKYLSDYKIQANPRAINLFYLAKNYRERLEIKDDIIFTSDGLNSWTKQEFIQKIIQNPEIISPNVLLRPLYQEVVLPNLAYIGGPGEIAYWLELPEMFTHANVQYPLPVVRNSYLFLKPKQIQQIQDLKLSLEDFFIREDLLTKLFVETNSTSEFSLSEEKSNLESLFEKIEKRAIAIDINLSKVVKGEYVKTVGGLEHLEKRFRNAEKSKFESQIKTVQQIRGKIFPNGNFQEREISLLEVILKGNLNVINELFLNKSFNDNIQVITY